MFTPRATWWAVTSSLTWARLAGVSGSAQRAPSRPQQRSLPVAVPWVTFLDPEAARVGLTEAEARARYGKSVRVHRWDMAQADRGIADGEAVGFIKVVARPDGRVIGASVVASRAGELIGEYTLAIQHGLRLSDLAGTIHAYPTWSTPLQQAGGRCGHTTLSRGARWAHHPTGGGAWPPLTRAYGPRQPRTPARAGQ